MAALAALSRRTALRCRGRAVAAWRRAAQFPTLPVKCAVVGESATVSLTCPPGSVVGPINFASYGTPTGSCGAFVRSTICNYDATAYVNSNCGGKNSCTLSPTFGAWNNVFGDPCSGVDKTFNVEVQCVIASLATPSGTVTPSATRTNSVRAGGEVECVVPPLVPILDPRLTPVPIPPPPPAHTNQVIKTSFQPTQESVW